MLVKRLDARPILEKAAAIGVRGSTAQVGPEEFVTTFTRGS